MPCEPRESSVFIILEKLLKCFYYFTFLRICKSNRLYSIFIIYSALLSNKNFFVYFPPPFHPPIASHLLSSRYYVFILPPILFLPILSYSPLCLCLTIIALFILLLFFFFFCIRYFTYLYGSTKLVLRLFIRSLLICSFLFIVILWITFIFIIFLFLSLSPSLFLFLFLSFKL